MKTITELLEKYDQLELAEIQFDIELAFYHGQMGTLSELRKIPNERGIKTGKFDAAIDQLADSIYTDFAAVLGG